jgi:catechol 2,3-dioxygenase-like lactoylglutathione lyase family enzyme
MVRIKHIAIRTLDPEKTAAFYRDVFGLQEVGQARAGVYLSDGYINLAILRSRGEGGEESPRDAAGYTGIHHLGFMVDDVDEICRKLDAAGATPMTGRAAAGDDRAGGGEPALIGRDVDAVAVGIAQRRSVRSMTSDTPPTRLTNSRPGTS